MNKFSENLLTTKKKTKKWANIFMGNQQSQLKEVENNLRNIYSLNSSGKFTEEELKEVREYELKQEELLAKEEELWGLKSRAIWIKEGYNNTKFFHRHATHRKNINTISETKNSNGDIVYCFKEKAEAG